MQVSGYGAKLTSPSTDAKLFSAWRFLSAHFPCHLPLAPETPNYTSYPDALCSLSHSTNCALSHGILFSQRALALPSMAQFTSEEPSSAAPVCAYPPTVCAHLL